jgi:hypothetical protein
MKCFPIYITKHESKLIDKLRRLTLKKSTKRPVEEFHRSFEVVDHILEESNDFGVTTIVVTLALKYMKENPSITISDAIILGYENWQNKNV